MFNFGTDRSVQKLSVSQRPLRYNSTSKTLRKSVSKQLQPDSITIVEGQEIFPDARKTPVIIMKNDHQNLRDRTLTFFERRIFDEHEFQRLEELIKKSIYNTAIPSYEHANLLDLLYIRRLIESSSASKTRFGATLSHGLNPEEGSILGINPSIDLPDVIVNGWMIDTKRIKISRLLYNNNLYRIECDPWVGNTQYRYVLYDNIVTDYYEENRSLFEQKNIFVSPDEFFYVEGIDDIVQIIQGILNERINSLKKQESGFFIYLGTCHFAQHAVTFILTVKKTKKIKRHHATPRMSAHCYYLDMNDIRTEGADFDRITREISTGIGIPIKYHEVYPKVHLNIGGENMFSYIGYCAVISCIFINFLLQFLLQFDTIKEHAPMYRILKKVYKTCISMKNINTVYGRDLWYYVVKNCAAATFLKNYNLEGTRSLNDQSNRNIDIWSDSLFPENYFDVVNMINTYNSESEYRFENSYTEWRQSPFVFDPEDQVNINFVKLSYALARFGCMETMLGIVLYEDDETTSLTDTLSSAVNDNRVDYYVINREHYSSLFGIVPEIRLSYEQWLFYVTELKMIIRFAPMSGNFEEILTLTKNGITKVDKTYTRFHIFGLNKNPYQVN